jgi:hypothetical protein
MDDMETALNGVDRGGFSEKIRILDNRSLYKPETL